MQRPAFDAGRVRPALRGGGVVPPIVELPNAMTSSEERTSAASVVPPIVELGERRDRPEWKRGGGKEREEQRREERAGKNGMVDGRNQHK